MTDGLNGNFKETIAEWRGSMSATMNAIQTQVTDIGHKLDIGVTKEEFNELKKDFKDFKKMITEKVAVLDKTAATEGAKSGLKWAVLIGILTIILSYLPLILKLINKI